MTPEDVLSHAPLALSQVQREFYFETGYLVVEDLVSREWLDRLRAVTNEMIEQSRSLTESNEAFDLGPEHSRDAPHVRRIRATVDRHPAYWEFASSSVVIDVVADLVGPDVKFHSSKLNFKRAQGGEEIKWHQDIQFWPHTNYSPLTLGLYLEDVSPEQGPLSVIPESHNGELFNLYDGDTWVGYIADEDMDLVTPDDAADLTGPAGTLTVINCRTIHGSRENRLGKPRPLLLNIYSSADAFAYTAMPTPTSRTGEIVRGTPARWAHLDPRPCLIPPEWDKTGYGSIYTVQRKEQEAKRG